jgi:hypothetical protein
MHRFEGLCKKPQYGMTEKTIRNDAEFAEAMMFAAALLYLFAPAIVYGGLALFLVTLLVL